MRWFLVKVTASGAVSLLLLLESAGIRLPRAATPFFIGSSSFSRSTPVRVATNRAVVSKDYSSTVTLTIGGDIGPEPEPEAEFAILHGPRVESHREASVPFGCQQTLYDNDGFYADLTAELQLYGPGGTQVGSAPPHWVSQKSAITSDYTWWLTDPPEGDYTCRAQYWVYSTYIGYNNDTKPFVYQMPTGESTFGNAWAGLSGYTTAYKWRGTLSGVGTTKFTGRLLYEEDGGGFVDTCYFSNGPFPSITFNMLSPNAATNPWTVEANNTYGDDIIGLSEDWVNEYRQWRDTCQLEWNQSMVINRPGTTKAEYKVNRVKMGLTQTTVWSYRDGNVVSKAW